MVVSVQAGLRQQESQRGLEHLGVPYDNQIYTGMPDGELEGQCQLLADEIVLAAQSLGITHLHTLGRQGYDGHSDHIATHEATMLATKQLADTAPASVLALNAAHKGELAVRGDPYRKLGAMACHISQFALHNDQFWAEFSRYTPLIWAQETYDHIAP